MQEAADSWERDEILIAPRYQLSRFVRDGLGRTAHSQGNWRLELASSRASSLLKNRSGDNRGVVVLTEIAKGCEVPPSKKKFPASLFGTADQIALESTTSAAWLPAPDCLARRGKRLPTPEPTSPGATGGSLRCTKVWRSASGLTCTRASRPGASSPTGCSGWSLSAGTATRSTGNLSVTAGFRVYGATLRNEVPPVSPEGSAPNWRTRRPLSTRCIRSSS